MAAGLHRITQGYGKDFETAAPLILTAALALGIGACGSSSSTAGATATSAQETAETTAGSPSAGKVDGSQGGSGEDLHPEFRRRSRLQLASSSPKLKGKSCGAILEALKGEAPASSRASTLRGPVASLRSEGERGFALHHGPGGVDYFVPMGREGGRWKVGALAPSEFP